MEPIKKHRIKFSGEIVEEYYCPECEYEVREDGFAFDTCSYGPESCETCGRCYCDQSC